MEEINNTVDLTKTYMQERKEYLCAIRKKKEKELASAPEGTLRICRNGNNAYYYRRTDPKDRSGVYLPKKDIHIAEKLAQKDYNEQVLRSIEKEIKAINRYLEGCPNVHIEEVYERLHIERQKLVNPIRQTDEQYIKEWVAVRYQGKEFEENTPEFFTVKGERVRSKSEIIIADLLAREGIPYRYEYPLYIKGYGTIYPDFTILNVRTRKEYYWEHFGMMDNSVYAEHAIQKIASYENSGIEIGEKLIVTYETKSMPMNQKQITRIVERKLK